VFQAHPAREAFLLVADGENVTQGVDFELVKVFVDDVVEEGFELDDAGVDFVLFLLEQGVAAGFFGGVGGFWGGAEAD
jgi:hypothetical protein